MTRPQATNDVYQDLSRFRLPHNFRGRSPMVVQLWWLVEATAFRWSPQVAYGWRRFLLRLFGAQVGRGVLVRPSVRTTYPWKVSIGDHAWVGDDVELYSLGEIVIGSHSVISQRSYICTGTHDTNRISFDISAHPIRIGSQCWLATDVFVAPGVSIGDGAVVGARSCVLTDLPPAMICYGSPARAIKPRTAGGAE
jgi:putative colanic acid biosynthesis acetyltransferase WcaF